MICINLDRIILMFFSQRAWSANVRRRFEYFRVNRKIIYFMFYQVISLALLCFEWLNSYIVLSSDNVCKMGGYFLYGVCKTHR